ncbi:hypothetical protein NPIL_437341 [Nephila pilipes]|uniref:Uncharacterized protein n=1 Tax=Nephila pilipes TaxID=299642 RepID=A0A8X6UCK2_NEPPI|nr:hypothetical protein NPIL_437341 [Nephila pilipes]
MILRHGDRKLNSAPLPIFDGLGKMKPEMPSEKERNVIDREATVCCTSEVVPIHSRPQGKLLTIGQDLDFFQAMISFSVSGFSGARKQMGNIIQRNDF